MGAAGVHYLGSIEWTSLAGSGRFYPCTGLAMGCGLSLLKFLKKTRILRATLMDVSYVALLRAINGGVARAESRKDDNVESWC